MTESALVITVSTGAAAGVYEDKSGPIIVAALDDLGLDVAGQDNDDVADTLSEHHVNIIACSSQTQADRIARLRFEFELADPGHLHSILLALKRVGSVYEATRVLPGART